MPEQRIYDVITHIEWPVIDYGQSGLLCGKLRLRQDFRVLCYGNSYFLCQMQR